jgi:hypothetical protein
MGKVAFLFVGVLLASFSCTFGSKWWVSIPQTWDGEDNEAASSYVTFLLNNNYDVRANQRNFLLVVVERSEYPNLKSQLLAQFPSASMEGVRLLATYKPEEKLYIFRTNTPSTGLNQTEQLQILNSMKGSPTVEAKASSSLGIRLVGIVEDNIIVGKPDDGPFPDWWPYQSTVVVQPVSSETIRAPAVYLGSYTHQISKAYSAQIQALVNAVQKDKLVASVSHLANYFTRLAYTTAPSTTEAQTWIKNYLANLGLEVSTSSFRSGYTSNVIGRLKGSKFPQKIVVIGAHYDSRARLMRADERAPGADDNASGTSAVLEIARVLASSKVPFENTIEFCLWSGEEQGLYGSAAYAKQLASQKAQVVAYLNADMISYKSPSEPVQLGFDAEGTSSQLTADMKKIAQQYVTDVAIGTATGCCTDSQSFKAQGFLSVSYFERRGGLINPYYHTSNDNYPQSANDFTQVTKITQAFLAGTATLAVPLA